jgi:DNA-binding transcriptional LysR family regulator
MTQPALSQALQRLEADLGVQLFVRRSRGLTLTRTGEDILAEARVTIAAADRVLATAAAHRRGQRDELVIGVLPEVFPLFEEPFVRFRRARPDVQVHLRELNFVTQESAVRRREVDIALVVAPAPDLQQLEVDRRPLVLAMASNHRLAEQPVVTLEDVERETFPRAHSDVPERWADEFWLTRQLGRRPRLAEEACATSAHITPQLVTGQCVCPTMDYLLTQHSQAVIVGRPLAGVGSLSLAFTWIKRTSAVAAFVEAMLAHRGAPDRTGRIPDTWR